MRWFIDCCWLLLTLLSLPFILPGLLRRGWFRTDWAGRRGRCAAPPEASASVAGPHVLLAAVSVGEVNAIRALVPALLDAGARVSVAVTTDTGIARAKALFEGRAHVVRYPFDMSGWVRRFLDTLQPDVVCLVELELWTNFLGA